MSQEGAQWLGAVEGYYGPPLEHAERKALVTWLGEHQFNCYGYAPKDDPLHRFRWRDPYPEEQEAEFRELIALGRSVGVEVAFVLSPGLDWRAGDEETLVRKLSRFADLGARVLGVAWDDVEPGGRDLGTAHASGVAAAVAGMGEGIRWITCPTDYSGMELTPYLESFMASLPPEVDVMWTGPGIVSERVTGKDAAAMSFALGRKVLFAENFPVNDGPMSGVLHLGPYPDRSSDLPAETTGVFCNFMSLPRASRLGLAVAARFWRDPGVDRERAWREELAAFPGLETLARASRSWAGDPTPDPELRAWSEAADDRLRAYLHGNCRAGLDPALAAEIGPWLDQWDREAQAMQIALELIAARPARPANYASFMCDLWGRARAYPEQLFGVRWAYYPLTERVGGMLHARPEGLLLGENLTDMLCTRALRG